MLVYQRVFGSILYCFFGYSRVLNIYIYIRCWIFPAGMRFTTITASQLRQIPSLSSPLSWTALVPWSSFMVTIANPSRTRNPHIKVIRLYIYISYTYTHTYIYIYIYIHIYTYIYTYIYIYTYPYKWIDNHPLCRKSPCSETLITVMAVVIWPPLNISLQLIGHGHGQKKKKTDIRKNHGRNHPDLRKNGWNWIVQDGDFFACHRQCSK